MNIAIKKILKVFAISAGVPYLVSVIMFISFFSQNFNRGIDYVFHPLAIPFFAITVFPVSLLSGLLITIILHIFSLLDKRIINVSFVVGFAIYSSIVPLIINNRWIDSWFNSLGFTLISLVIVLIFINIQKWIKK